jgi:hypothetical protein
MEVQVRPLTVATPRFIQMGMPLPPLKPMDQSRRGGIQVGEAQHLHLIKYRTVLIQSFLKLTDYNT